MIGLNECKAAIHRTECSELVWDGTSCSEPILTMRDGALVDNFFVYAHNDEQTEYALPLAVFGIRAEEKTAVYARSAEPEEIKLHKTQPRPVTKELFARYEALYPRVREIAFSTCGAEGKQMLREYLSGLEKLSPPPIWSAYNELFPDFFQWAEREVSSIEEV